ncbi:MAG: uncharacterized protein JWO36_4290 [Myxococcales bacterium]|nr:uncharacterized protein [Myxococcales bacterium]
MTEPSTGVLACLRNADPACAITVGEALNALGRHAVFGAVQSLEDARVLMEHHVWAVWDFMSLLKSLQAELASTKVPWVPPADASAARFINEIATLEEGDDGPDGIPASHFEIYLQAMGEAGADTKPIRTFIAEIAAGVPWEVSLQRVGVSRAAADFVRTTMDVIGRPLWARVAAFTIGREEVIPAMFTSLIGELGSQHSGLDRLRWYLRRHIDVDGGTHGPMSARLFQRICLIDDETCRRSADVGLEVLRARATLWDAVRNELIHRAPTATIAERPTTTA